MDIKPEMTDYDSDEKERIAGVSGGTFLVYCPSWCEEEFAIATLENGKFFSQASEDMNEYVEKYMELEQFL